MPYAPFHTIFPEIAEKETRSIKTLSYYKELPPDDYGLLELYCDEQSCDCRRVFLYVISNKQQKDLAVIAFGWESDKFYAKWLGDNDPKVINELKGPVLNLASPQSKYAPAILKLVKESVLHDKNYIERLKKHYKLWGVVG